MQQFFALAGGLNVKNMWLGFLLRLAVVVVDQVAIMVAMHHATLLITHHHLSRVILLF